MEGATSWIFKPTCPMVKSWNSTQIDMGTAVLQPHREWEQSFPLLISVSAANESFLRFTPGKQRPISRWRYTLKNGGNRLQVPSDCRLLDVSGRSDGGNRFRGLLVSLYLLPMTKKASREARISKCGCGEKFKPAITGPA